jgi:nicotinate-nucleotide adenylyltransferase
MVRQAISQDPSFVVSDVEVAQRSKSYSIDTVQALRQDFGSTAELFFIIGLDAFLELPTWKQAPDLLRTCHFVVLPRPGVAFVSLLDMPILPSLERASLESIDAQRQGRLDIPLSASTALILLWIPPCVISSSDIRRRLQQRLPVSDLLPVPVDSYIMQQALYQEESDRTGV